ncbi:hypothetical protein LUZ62_058601 [Rhynchospora pubera]|uniref:Uncharacterized protein n=1 Tax=Rhynchospora pubera TaxID=906938 RepID=A0AAV8E254_9POAL|nr:hypothetical protein LUZ62_058601 [Rhynchospora pubera]
MGCEEVRSKSNGVFKKRRRRGFWTVFSCFGGGADMATKVSRGKRVAVVPVDGESDHKVTHGDVIVAKKERKKEMNCRRSFKDKSKVTDAPTKPQPTKEITTMHQVASNLKPQIEPAPVYWMLDPVQTQTQNRTSRPASPKPVNQPASEMVCEESLKKDGYGPYMGLCVLTFALAVMVLGGLTFGVICVCGWFGVLYMLKPVTKLEQDSGTIEQKLEEVDVNSVEYKKMVVLRGFLERGKRKSF